MQYLLGLKMQLYGRQIRTYSSSFFITHPPSRSSFILILEQGRTIGSLQSQCHSDHATALMGLHTFTGDDCNSAFRGKEKVYPLMKLQKYHRFQKVSMDLGSHWKVKDDVYEVLEEFICLMYGNTCIKCINEVHVLMLRKTVGEEDKLSSKSKVGFSCLPPCKDSLNPHIDRVNYRLCEWNIPIYDCPLIRTAMVGPRMMTPSSPSGPVDPSFPLTWWISLRKET